MKRIQMVDLIGQHAKIESELQEAIQRVMRTGAFVKGPEVQAFSEELAEHTGSSFVVPCGNGTDALQIALMALGLKPGDEVITSAFTFIATAEVIVLLGLIIGGDGRRCALTTTLHPLSFKQEGSSLERIHTLFH